MSQGYADASLGPPGSSSPAPRQTVGPAFERHYRIGELAEMWKLGRETVRLLVKDEASVDTQNRPLIDTSKPAIS